MFTVRLATPNEVADFGTHAYPSENWVVVNHHDRVITADVFPNEACAIAYLKGE